jgi:hypothetical protein
MKICQQRKSQQELEMKLFELIGDNGFDLLMTIVPHADTIQFFLEENIDFAATNGPNIPNTTRVISKKETPFEALSVNQKKKFIQREQKEMDELVKFSEENYSEDQFGGGNMDWLRSLGFNEEYLNEERRLGLQKNRNFQETWTENLQPAGSRFLYEGLNRGLPGDLLETWVRALKKSLFPLPNHLEHPNRMKYWKFLKYSNPGLGRHSRHGSFKSNSIGGL